MPPFFTIITSTYNAAATLPRLLDSLASQTCRDFNWIVQDGASSDATMQIVEQYRDRLPEILADSSKDNGIYDAWNKAIDRWQEKMGEWILFLGCDDSLNGKDTLEIVKKHIDKSPNHKIFFAGNMIQINSLGEKISKYAIKSTNDAFKRKSYRMPVNHPALFTKKEIIVRHKFDASFKISGDYEFIRRVWLEPDQMQLLGFVTTRMQIGGISGNESSRKLHLSENLRIFNKYGTIRGYIWYIDLSLYSAKIKIKSILKEYRYGNKFWETLKKLRAYILK